ncbi:MAG: hypothetical protein K9J83_01845 [Desulfarculaceae bacterium]|nr:hypothetical protein [Desulfarculaceae bacterium]
MRRFFMVCVSVMFAVLLCAPVHAGDQAPIDKGELDRFLADLPETPGLTAGGMEKMNAVKQGKTPDMEFMKQGMEASNSAIEKKGWDTDRFYYVFGHVMMVTAMENIDRLTEQVAPQMAEAMKAIKDNPNISQAQKKQMLQQMDQGMMGANADLKDMRARVKKEVPDSEKRLILSRYSEICEAIGMPESPD